MKNCLVKILIRFHLNNTNNQNTTLKAKKGGVPTFQKTKYDAWWNHCKMGLFGAINKAKKYNAHITINPRPIVYLSKTKTLNDVFDL